MGSVVVAMVLERDDVAREICEIQFMPAWHISNPNTYRAHNFTLFHRLQSLRYCISDLDTRLLQLLRRSPETRIFFYTGRQLCAGTNVKVIHIIEKLVDRPVHAHTLP